MDENQRIRLSKQLLRESLTGLLCTKSIHKISVREICDRAQINRTTFYKYYGSPYDLLQDMEREVLSQIDKYLCSVNVPDNNSLPQLTQILIFINNNLDLCRILLNNNIGPEFPAKLIGLPRIRQILTLQLQSKYSENELEYMFNFVVSGSFEIIVSWINKQNREPPEQIAELLSETILKLFPAVD